jgi:hypothetical protein
MRCDLTTFWAPPTRFTLVLASTGVDIKTQ